jgi:hypothetical protein
MVVAALSAAAPALLLRARLTGETALNHFFFVFRMINE